MAHEKRVNAALWLPDGTGLLSAGIDGRIRLWRPNGSMIRELKAAGPVETVAVSRDSRWLHEHPELRSQDPRLASALLSAGLTQDDVFREVVRTVAAVLDKQAPIWRQHYAGPFNADDGSTTQTELGTPGRHGGGRVLTLLVRFRRYSHW